MAEFELATNIAILGGLTYIALGAAVLAAAPRNAANVGFALFAVSSGAASASLRILARFGIDPLAGPLAIAHLALQAGGLVGVVLLARAFPQPLAARDRPAAVAGVAVGTLLGALWALWWARFMRAIPGSRWEFLVVGEMDAVAAGVTWAFLVMLALRAARHPKDGASHAVVTLAIVAPSAVGLGGVLAWTFETFPGDAAHRLAIGAVAIGSLLALWLRNLALGVPRKWALAVAWGVPLAVIGGMIAYSRGVATVGNEAWNVTVGIVRVAAGVVLAYAIVRGQVPGLDTKVRWTVSRGTIAGAFVAVFFVGSEAAQQFFGETTGSAYVGILAAGALVFAIAPLQRVAERLAERAVPLASVPAASPRDPGRDEVYLNMLRVALRDKRLTREEEVHLHRLAASLGIDAGRAHELLVQAERELESRS